MPDVDKIMVAEGIEESPGVESVKVENVIDDPFINKLNALPDSENDTVDADLVISRESSGWVKKTAEKVWNYIKDKIDTVLGLTAEEYGGNAATATTATSATTAGTAAKLERFKAGDNANEEHDANAAINNGHYYYSSNGPTTAQGAQSTDGALYVQRYNDNWVGQIAQDYRDGDLFTRGKNNGAWTAWRKQINSSEYPTHGIRYGGTDTTTKIKIKINSTASWMLCFTVTLYQGYRATKVMVSGYQYGANHWYQPEAVLLGDSDFGETLTVYFGYDATNALWVGFNGGNYTGVVISDVTNGYTQIADYSGLFEISNVSSLATIQSTITAYSKAYKAIYDNNGYAIDSTMTYHGSAGGAVTGVTISGYTSNVKTLHAHHINREGHIMLCLLDFTTARAFSAYSNYDIGKFTNAGDIPNGSRFTVSTISADGYANEANPWISIEANGVIRLCTRVTAFAANTRMYAKFVFTLG